MGHWYLPQVDGMCPVARGGAACVAVGNQILMFGGADRVPQVFDDLWLLETGGGTFEWTRIAANIAPGTELFARCGAALTAVHDKIYLMGGQDPVNGTVFNDVMVLDTKTWEWSEVEIVFGGAAPRGTLGDVWIFNLDQRVWTRPNVSGYVPPAREMHTGVMVDAATMVVFGGRGEDGRILCDAAVFDARTMAWIAQEPTPFSRCAHSAVLMPTADATERELSTSGTATPSQQSVVIYGGFSGEAVEGDVLRIDPSTLEVEIVSKGPRPSAPQGSMPAPRFAHCAASVPVPAPDADESSMAMLVFGGVNPTEDLSDIAIWTVRPSNVPSVPPPAAAPSPAPAAPTTSSPTAASAAAAPTPPATSSPAPAPAAQSTPGSAEQDVGAAAVSRAPATPAQTSSTDTPMANNEGAASPQGPAIIEVDLEGAADVQETPQAPVEAMDTGDK